MNRYCVTKFYNKWLVYDDVAKVCEPTDKASSKAEALKRAKILNCPSQVWVTTDSRPSDDFLRDVAKFFSERGYLPDDGGWEQNPDSPTWQISYSK